jgi:branched-chain amino acid aminotransferase
MDEYLFQIPHNYPTAQNYQEGINTITYESIRENPGVKYVNDTLRTLTNQLIQKHHVYEVLLVDHEGYITEGSRSNVFFIKDNTLYTSPIEYVLPGTSRKRVFDICREYQLPIVEQRIAKNSLHEFDVAFLTGTSPLILPINQIDTIHYDVNLPFLRQLMDHYFALLKK